MIGAVVRRLFPALGAAADFSRLPALAKAEHHRDRAGVPPGDPGTDAVLPETVEWLGRAQDRCPSGDGGVARGFSLVNGWETSYPETTGYIVPTMLDCAERFGVDAYRQRAIRMLDWLVSIQFPDGGFQGGKIDAEPRVPVTFNTGQILLGLARGAQEDERYHEPMRRAACWLAASLDPDGCWRKHPSPFAAPGEKTYETHVAWGMFEADRVEPDEGFGEAGLRQVRWALTNQKPNGWFRHCCLDRSDAPLTHTIGYALRGIIEAYRFRPDPEFLAACRRTADGVAATIAPDGYLSGRLDDGWSPAADFACLTGSVQLAHCLFMLYELTGEVRYRDKAERLNLYVRRTVRLDGPDETRGAVKGSFPVNGHYGRYQYLNWAAKFFVDANLLESRIREAPPPKLGDSAAQ